MNKAVSTKNAPAAIGPYSQAIRSGSTVYVSGQIPIDPAIAASCDSGRIESFRQNWMEGVADVLSALKA